VFTIAGLVGVAITLLALTSKYYRQLSEAYANAPDPVAAAAAPAPPASA
jgi:DHA3 family multidrug efflux protein-like MFS transporter